MSDETKRTTFRRDPTLPFQRMSEEVIVIDPKTRSVHLFNETAARVWDLLETQSSIDELVEALAGEYDDAPAETVRAEVEALLADLSEKGLLGARGRA